MRSRLLGSLALAAFLTTVGCGTAMTSPSTSTSVAALAAGLSVGTWSSVQAASSQSGTCGAFTWSITNITATSVSGTFSATCNGNVQMSGSGSAQATIGVNGISWSGTGTASVPGNNACAIALNGTIEASSTGFKIPYSGTTCLGPVSGTETLGKK